MKLNKIALAGALAFGLTTVAAQAADAGAGKVTFNGSIIDSPCSITPDSVDQTIEMGKIANKTLANGGTSTPVTFNIGLQDCDITAASGDVAPNNSNDEVTVAFTGVTGSVADTFGLYGTSKGANLIIQTANGAALKPGTASPAQLLTNGDNQLTFQAYLQGDSAKEIVPGDFQSVVNFTMAYE